MPDTPKPLVGAPPGVAQPGTSGCLGTHVYDMENYGPGFTQRVVGGKENVSMAALAGRDVNEAAERQSTPKS